MFVVTISTSRWKEAEMKYIESPNRYQKLPNERTIFLAGGITGCPNWQQEIVQLLAHTDLVLLNPRQKNFPIDNPKAALAQIQWEFEHLKIADAILFWFAEETICPIALYELGAWSMTSKPIYVGVHPDYERRLDIEVQTQLRRPEVKIVYSLSELAKQIRGSGANQTQST